MTAVTPIKPGQTLTLTGVVITASEPAKNAWYGASFVQVRVRIDDGPRGARFADVRLAADTDGKWFGPRAHDALAQLDGDAHEGDDARDELMRLTKPKLAERALAAGVDISGAKTKTDIINVILSGIPKAA